MKLLKKILKSPGVQTMMVLLAVGYIKLCFKSGRWELKGVETLNHHARHKIPMIVAFWHGRMFMMPCFSYLANETYAMTSRHGDGKFISRINDHFNLRTISGSSNTKGKNRGGATAIREAISLISEGKNVVITPDGPRGPRMRVSSAIVEIAQITGAPIIPITFSAKPSKIVPSWDRFLVPLPFAKCFYQVGEPIKINAEASLAELETYRNDVENALNSITRIVDQKSGIKPIEPE